MASEDAYEFDLAYITAHILMKGDETKTKLKPSGEVSFSKYENKKISLL